MMEGLRQWMLSLVALCMLLAVVRVLVPGGTMSRVAAFIGGLVLLAALAQPLAKLGAVRFALPDYAGEMERLERQLEEENETALAEGIEERTEAYISDKAASMGLAGTCRVETKPTEEGVPLPWSVELEMPRSAELAAWIEGELDIPAERQVWHGAEGEN